MAGRLAPRLLDGVLSAVEPFLESWIEPLTSEQVDLSGALVGNIRLSHLQFRPKVIDSLRLPLELVFSYIGSIEISVPVWRVFSSSVSVKISDVVVVVKTKPLCEWNKAKFVSSYLDSKWAALKANELRAFVDPMENGMLWNFGMHIAKNCSISITNMHVRFEDSLTMPAQPYAFGILLPSLEAQPNCGNVGDESNGNCVDSSLLLNANAIPSEEAIKLRSVLYHRVVIKGLRPYLDHYPTPTSTHSRTNASPKRRQNPKSGSSRASSKGCSDTAEVASGDERIISLPLPVSLLKRRRILRSDTTSAATAAPVDLTPCSVSPHDGNSVHRDTPAESTLQATFADSPASETQHQALEYQVLPSPDEQNTKSKWTERLATSWLGYWFNKRSGAPVQSPVVVTPQIQENRDQSTSSSPEDCSSGLTANLSPSAEGSPFHRQQFVPPSGADGKGASDCSASPQVGRTRSFTKLDNSHSAKTKSTTDQTESSNLDSLADSQVPEFEDFPMDGREPFFTRVQKYCTLLLYDPQRDTWTSAFMLDSTDNQNTPGSVQARFSPITTGTNPSRATGTAAIIGQILAVKMKRTVKESQKQARLRVGALRGIGLASADNRKGILIKNRLVSPKFDHLAGSRDSPKNKRVVIVERKETLHKNDVAKQLTSYRVDLSRLADFRKVLENTFHAFHDFLTTPMHIEVNLRSMSCPIQVLKPERLLFAEEHPYFADSDPIFVPPKCSTAPAATLDIKLYPTRISFADKQLDTFLRWINYHFSMSSRWKKGILAQCEIPLPTSPAEEEAYEQAWLQILILEAQGAIKAKVANSPSSGAASPQASIGELRNWCEEFEVRYPLSLTLLVRKRALDRFNAIREALETTPDENATTAPYKNAGMKFSDLLTKWFRGSNTAKSLPNHQSDSPAVKVDLLKDSLRDYATNFLDQINANLQYLTKIRKFDFTESVDVRIDARDLHCSLLFRSVEIDGRTSCTETAVLVQAVQMGLRVLMEGSIRMNMKVSALTVMAGRCAAMPNETYTILFSRVDSHNNTDGSTAEKSDTEDPLGAIALEAFQSFHHLLHTSPRFKYADCYCSNLLFHMVQEVVLATKEYRANAMLSAKTRQLIRHNRRSGRIKYHTLNSISAVKQDDSIADVEAAKLRLSRSLKTSEYLIMAISPVVKNHGRIGEVSPSKNESSFFTPRRQIISTPQAAETSLRSHFLIRSMLRGATDSPKIQRESTATVKPPAVVLALSSPAYRVAKLPDTWLRLQVESPITALCSPQLIVEILRDTVPFTNYLSRKDINLLYEVARQSPVLAGYDFTDAIAGDTVAHRSSLDMIVKLSAPLFAAVCRNKTSTFDAPACGFSLSSVTFLSIAAPRQPDDSVIKRNRRIDRMTVCARNIRLDRCSNLGRFVSAIVIYPAHGAQFESYTIEEVFLRRKRRKTTGEADVPIISEIMLPIPAFTVDIQTKHPPCYADEIAMHADILLPELSLRILESDIALWQPCYSETVHEYARSHSHFMHLEHETKLNALANDLFVEAALRATAEAHASQFPIPPELPPLPLPNPTLDRLMIKDKLNDLETNEAKAVDLVVENVDNLALPRQQRVHYSVKKSNFPVEGQSEIAGRIDNCDSETNLNPICTPSTAIDDDTSGSGNKNETIVETRNPRDFFESPLKPRIRSSFTSNGIAEERQSHRTLHNTHSLKSESSVLQGFESIYREADSRSHTTKESSSHETDGYTGSADGVSVMKSVIHIQLGKLVVCYMVLNDDAVPTEQAIKPFKRRASLNEQSLNYKKFATAVVPHDPVVLGYHSDALHSALIRFEMQSLYAAMTTTSDGTIATSVSIESLKLLDQFSTCPTNAGGVPIYSCNVNTEKSQSQDPLMPDSAREQRSRDALQCGDPHLYSRVTALGNITLCKFASSFPCYLMQQQRKDLATKSILANGQKAPHITLRYSGTTKAHACRHHVDFHLSAFDCKVYWEFLDECLLAVHNAQKHCTPLSDVLGSVESRTPGKDDTLGVTVQKDLTNIIENNNLLTEKQRLVTKLSEPIRREESYWFAEDQSPILDGNVVIDGFTVNVACSPLWIPISDASITEFVTRLSTPEKIRSHPFPSFYLADEDPNVASGLGDLAGFPKMASLGLYNTKKGRVDFQPPGHAALIIRMGTLYLILKGQKTRPERTFVSSDRVLPPKLLEMQSSFFASTPLQHATTLTEMPTPQCTLPQEEPVLPNTFLANGYLVDPEDDELSSDSDRNSGRRIAPVMAHDAFREEPPLEALGAAHVYAPVPILMKKLPSALEDYLQSVLQFSLTITFIEADVQLPGTEKSNLVPFLHPLRMTTKLEVKLPSLRGVAEKLCGFTTLDALHLRKEVGIFTDPTCEDLTVRISLQLEPIYITIGSDVAATLSALAALAVAFGEIQARRTSSASRLQSGPKTVTFLEYEPNDPPPEDVVEFSCSSSDGEERAIDGVGPLEEDSSGNSFVDLETLQRLKFPSQQPRGPTASNAHYAGLDCFQHTVIIAADVSVELIRMELWSATAFSERQKLFCIIVEDIILRAETTPVHRIIPWGVFCYPEESNVIAAGLRDFKSDNGRTILLENPPWWRRLNRLDAIVETGSVGNLSHTTSFSSIDGSPFKPNVSQNLHLFLRAKDYVKTLLNPAGKAKPLDNSLSFVDLIYQDCYGVFTTTLDEKGQPLHMYANSQQAIQSKATGASPYDLMRTLQWRLRHRKPWLQAHLSLQVWATRLSRQDQVHEALLEPWQLTGSLIKRKAQGTIQVNGTGSWANLTMNTASIDAGLVYFFAWLESLDDFSVALSLPRIGEFFNSEKHERVSRHNDPDSAGVRNNRKAGFSAVSEVEQSAKSALQTYPSNSWHQPTSKHQYVARTGAWDLQPVDNMLLVMRRFPTRLDCFSAILGFCQSSLVKSNRNIARKYLSPSGDLPGDAIQFKKSNQNVPSPSVTSVFLGAASLESTAARGGAFGAAKTPFVIHNKLGQPLAVTENNGQTWFILRAEGTKQIEAPDQGSGSLRLRIALANQVFELTTSHFSVTAEDARIIYLLLHHSNTARYSTLQASNKMRTDQTTRKARKMQNLREISAGGNAEALSALGCRELLAVLAQTSRCGARGERSAVFHLSLSSNLTLRNDTSFPLIVFPGRSVERPGTTLIRTKAAERKLSSNDGFVPSPLSDAMRTTITFPQEASYSSANKTSYVNAPFRELLTTPQPLNTLQENSDMIEGSAKVEIREPEAITQHVLVHPVLLPPSEECLVEQNRSEMSGTGFERPHLLRGRFAGSQRRPVGAALAFGAAAGLSAVNRGVEVLMPIASIPWYRPPATTSDTHQRGLDGVQNYGSSRIQLNQDGSQRWPRERSREETAVGLFTALHRASVDKSSKEISSELLSRSGKSPERRGTELICPSEDTPSQVSVVGDMIWSPASTFNGSALEGLSDSFGDFTGRSQFTVYSEDMEPAERSLFLDPLFPSLESRLGQSVSPSRSNKSQDLPETRLATQRLSNKALSPSTLPVSPGSTSTYSSPICEEIPNKDGEGAFSKRRRAVRFLARHSRSRRRSQSSEKGTTSHISSGYAAFLQSEAYTYLNHTLVGEAGVHYLLLPPGIKTVVAVPLYWLLLKSHTLFAGLAHSFGDSTNPSSHFYTPTQKLPLINEFSSSNTSAITLRHLLLLSDDAASRGKASRVLTERTLNSISSFNPTRNSEDLFWSPNVHPCKLQLRDPSNLDVTLVSSVTVAIPSKFKAGYGSIFEVTVEPPVEIINRTPKLLNLYVAIRDIYTPQPLIKSLQSSAAKSPTATGAFEACKSEELYSCNDINSDSPIPYIGSNRHRDSKLCDQRAGHSMLTGSKSTPVPLRSNFSPNARLAEKTGGDSVASHLRSPYKRLARDTQADAFLSPFSMGALSPTSSSHRETALLEPPTLVIERGESTPFYLTRGITSGVVMGIEDYRSELLRLETKTPAQSDPNFNVGTVLFIREEASKLPKQKKRGPKRERTEWRVPTSVGHRSKVMSSRRLRSSPQTTPDRNSTTSYTDSSFRGRFRATQLTIASRHQSALVQSDSTRRRRQQDRLSFGTCRSEQLFDPSEGEEDPEAELRLDMSHECSDLVSASNHKTAKASLRLNFEWGSRTPRHENGRIHRMRRFVCCTLARTLTIYPEAWAVNRLPYAVLLHGRGNLPTILPPFRRILISSQLVNRGAALSVSVPKTQIKDIPALEYYSHSTDMRLMQRLRGGEAVSNTFKLAELSTIDVRIPRTTIAPQLSLAVSMTKAPSPFLRTCSIEIRPRFVMANDTSYVLWVREALGKNLRFLKRFGGSPGYFRLAPKERLELHPQTTTKMRRVQLQITASPAAWKYYSKILRPTLQKSTMSLGVSPTDYRRDSHLWSAPLRLNSPCVEQLRHPSCHKPMVSIGDYITTEAEVTIHNGVHLIRFVEPGVPDFRFLNASSVTFAVAQHKLVGPFEVMPSQIIADRTLSQLGFNDGVRTVLGRQTNSNAVAKETVQRNSFKSLPLAASIDSLIDHFTKSDAPPDPALVKRIERFTLPFAFYKPSSAKRIDIWLAADPSGLWETENRRDNGNQSNGRLRKGEQLDEKTAIQVILDARRREFENGMTNKRSKKFHENYRNVVSPTSDGPRSGFHMKSTENESTSVQPYYASVAAAAASEKKRERDALHFWKFFREDHSSCIDLYAQFRLLKQRKLSGQKGPFHLLLPLRDPDGHGAPLRTLCVSLTMIAGSRWLIFTDYKSTIPPTLPAQLQRKFFHAEKNDAFENKRFHFSRDDAIQDFVEATVKATAGNLQFGSADSTATIACLYLKVQRDDKLALSELTVLAKHSQSALDQLARIWHAGTPHARKQVHTAIADATGQDIKKLNAKFRTQHGTENVGRMHGSTKSALYLQANLNKENQQKEKYESVDDTILVLGKIAPVLRRSTQEDEKRGIPFAADSSHNDIWNKTLNAVIQLAGIGVSFVNHAPNEVSYFSVARIAGTVRLKPDEIKFRVGLGWMQLDDPSPHAFYPTILRPVADTFIGVNRSTSRAISADPFTPQLHDTAFSGTRKSDAEAITVNDLFQGRDGGGAAPPQFLSEISLPPLRPLGVSNEFSFMVADFDLKRNSPEEISRGLVELPAVSLDLLPLAINVDSQFLRTTLLFADDILACFGAERDLLRNDLQTVVSSEKDPPGSPAWVKLLGPATRVLEACETAGSVRKVFISSLEISSLTVVLNYRNRRVNEPSDTSQRAAEASRDKLIDMTPDPSRKKPQRSKATDHRNKRTGFSASSLGHEFVDDPFGNSPGLDAQDEPRDELIKSILAKLPFLTIISDVSITLTNRSDRDLCGTAEQLTTALAMSYITPTVKQLHKLIGALDIIGNPSVFCRHVYYGTYNGVRELGVAASRFQRQRRLGGPDRPCLTCCQLCLSAHGRCAGSVCCGCAGGILDCLTRFTGSWFAVCHRLSRNTVVRKEGQTNQPTNLVEGCWAGWSRSCLNLGVVAANVVYKPWRGAMIRYDDLTAGEQAIAPSGCDKADALAAGCWSGCCSGLAGVLGGLPSSVLLCCQMSTAGALRQISNFSALRLIRPRRRFFGVFGDRLDAYSPFMSTISLTAEHSNLRSAVVNTSGALVLSDRFECTSDQVPWVEWDRRQKAAARYPRLEDARERVWRPAGREIASCWGNAQASGSTCWRLPIKSMTPTSGSLGGNATYVYSLATNDSWLRMLILGSSRIGYLERKTLVWFVALKDIVRIDVVSINHKWVNRMANTKSGVKPTRSYRPPSNIATLKKGSYAKQKTQARTKSGIRLLLAGKGTAASAAAAVKVEDDAPEEVFKLWTSGSNTLTPSEAQKGLVSDSIFRPDVDAPMVNNNLLTPEKGMSPISSKSSDKMSFRPEETVGNDATSALPGEFSGSIFSRLPTSNELDPTIVFFHVSPQAVTTTPTGDANHDLPNDSENAPWSFPRMEITVSQPTATSEASVRHKKTEKTAQCFENPKDPEKSTEKILWVNTSAEHAAEPLCDASEETVLSKSVAANMHSGNGSNIEPNQTRPGENEMVPEVAPAKTVPQNMNQSTIVLETRTEGKSVRVKFDDSPCIATDNAPDSGQPVANSRKVTSQVTLPHKTRNVRSNLIKLPTTSLRQQRSLRVSFNKARAKKGNILLHTSPKLGDASQPIKFLITGQRHYLRFVTRGPATGSVTRAIVDETGKTKNPVMERLQSRRLPRSTPHDARSKIQGRRDSCDHTMLENFSANRVYLARVRNKKIAIQTYEILSNIITISTPRNARNRS